MTAVMDLLLDLANILGGFLLATALLRLSPRIGPGLDRASSALAPFAWLVGTAALVAGGYFLIVHVTDGPHIFYFEVVGIAVGVALLWDRITGRDLPSAGSQGQVSGAPLLLAIFGIIAIIVGVQGLFTPN
jgi:hypothetical protein